MDCSRHSLVDSISRCNSYKYVNPSWMWNYCFIESMYLYSDSETLIAINKKHIYRHNTMPRKISEQFVQAILNQVKENNLIAEFNYESYSKSVATFVMEHNIWTIECIDSEGFIVFYPTTEPEKICWKPDLSFIVIR